MFKTGPKENYFLTGKDVKNLLIIFVILVIIYCFFVP